MKVSCGTSNRRISQSAGRSLLARLQAAGISCTYGLLSSLTVLMQRASVVLVGAASVLGNGALYARSGTALCAKAAHACRVPVIVCCETYKFSEHIRLDGYSLNESAPPTDLLSTHPSDTLISRQEWETQQQNGPGLHSLVLLYDITPPQYITMVASEVGLSTPESVGVILRDYKSVLYVQ